MEDVWKNVWKNKILRMDEVSLKDYVKAYKFVILWFVLIWGGLFSMVYVILL